MQGNTMHAINLGSARFVHQHPRAHAEPRRARSRPVQAAGAAGGAGGEGSAAVALREDVAAAAAAAAEREGRGAYEEEQGTVEEEEELIAELGEQSREAEEEIAQLTTGEQPREAEEEEAEEGEGLDGSVEEVEDVARELEMEVSGIRAEAETEAVALEEVDRIIADEEAAREAAASTGAYR